MDKGIRPALKECPDISGYDVIFLGFPNWWNTLPMPVVTFLEQCSWGGKKIIPLRKRLRQEPGGFEEVCLRSGDPPRRGIFGT